MNYSPEIIEQARTLWKQGVQRKRIALMLKISDRTVGRMCEGLDKPFEHRGTAQKKRFASKRLYWKDD